MFCPPQAWKIKPLRPMWVHEIFSFCGAPTYRSRLCKTKWWPPMPAAGEIFGGFGVRFIQKNTSLQGGSARRRRKFLGIWGALYTKITLLGCIQERVSGAKHPPKSSKFSASGGPNPQMLEKTPPLVPKVGTTRGGVFSNIWLDFRIFGKNTPKNFRRFAAKKTQHQWF